MDRFPEVTDAVVKCSECKTSTHLTDYFRVKRFGGGRWDRPGRWYDTTICNDCFGRASAYFHDADRRGERATKWYGISRQSIENNLQRWT